MTPTSPIPYDQRLSWFHDARFGLFIHYGLYAVAGRGEWLMFNERMPAAEYAAFAEQCRPAPDAVEQWLDLAVRAGMKYAVLTSRHHDGFSLFDSPVNAFNATKTWDRDLVAEFTDACRQRGLRVGLYYSLLDWRFPGYFEPEQHPQSAIDLVEQVHAEVRHLMSHYGQIDVLWYDGGWIDHGRKQVEPASFWRSQELNQMVYDLQPGILINNRSGIPLDLDTPEQQVKASEAGRGWEACMTIGDSAGWGYLKHNPNRKSLATLLQHLVTAAAGEGNFLINIGPAADGSVDPEDRSRLEAMGQWLAAHGEAIHGSQRCDLYDQRNPGAPIGRWTRCGNVGYLHVFRWPGEQFTVPLVGTPVKEARLLASGERVAHEHGSDHRLHLRELPATPPHAAVNTIRVAFVDEPARAAEPDHAQWLSP